MAPRVGGEAQMIAEIENHRMQNWGEETSSKKKLRCTCMQKEKREKIRK